MKIALLFLILAAGAAGAAERHNMMYGGGIGSCGSWTQERAEHQRAVWGNDLSWSLGYITAVSVTPGTTQFKRIDSDAVIAWLDKYCAANPLDMIMDADDALLAAITL